MGYELIEIMKYKLNINGEIYLIYVKSEDELTEFYIQKETYGIISFEIGLNLEKLGCGIENFIEDNINEWVYSYEQDLEKLEEE